MSRAGTADAGESGPSRQRVRRAALGLFATKGFHGTGIRDIADAANVSTATLYHYMGTKEDLLVDIMQVSLTRLTTGARRVVDEAEFPAAALDGLVQVHVLAHALHQAETIVVDNEIAALSPARRTEVLELRDTYEQVWRSVVEDGCTSGAFQVPDARVARLALLEMCTGVARWYSPRGELPLPAIASAHAQMALRLLGVPGAPQDPVAPGSGRYFDVVADVWGIRVADESHGASG